MCQETAGGKSIAAGAAYSGVTFERRAGAVLSSSNEVVLFQCMSHLALMLYLWLSSCTGPAAVQPIDSRRERDKGRGKKQLMKRREGGLERVCCRVTDTQRVEERERGC